MWLLDMKAKHGEDWEHKPAQGLKALLTQNWSLGTLNKKIVRNIILSLVITGSSYAILAFRLFPHYKIVAATLYGLSWVPLIISFLEKRVLAHARKLHGIIKPYLLHIAVAVILLCAGYVAHVLIPVEDTYLATVPAEDLRQSIKEDRQTLYVANSTMKSMIDWAREEEVFSKDLAALGPAEKNAIRETWHNFITACVEFDLIRNKT